MSVKSGGYLPPLREYLLTIPWNTVYDLYLQHRGGPRVCDGVSTTQRSCGNHNKYILDFAVECVVVSSS